MYAPISLAVGVDQACDDYQLLINAFSQRNERCLPIHAIHQEQDYKEIDRDTRDNRLLLWQTPSDPDLKVHVFANNIAVVEINLALSDDNNADELAALCQEHTKQRMAQVYPLLIADLKRLFEQGNSKQLCFEQAPSSPNIYWMSRTLITDAQDLKQPKLQQLLRTWLKDTQRPSDADDMIEGNLSYSLSWLNYAITDIQTPSQPTDQDDPRIGAMVLAQYYYSAQENCNKLLKQAINSAFNSKELSQSERQLSYSRAVTRLHLIDFHEHKKFLNRYKRKLLDQIMDNWDFHQLTENSQRMIEVCSSRLEEADNKKRERSTIMTDLLLVTLSFFAVFELSLYLTEFSREMMSRPALDYNDDQSSIFLEFIAGIDADIMFGLGFGLTFLLILTYRFIKVR